MKSFVIKSNDFFDSIIKSRDVEIKDDFITLKTNDGELQAKLAVNPTYVRSFKILDKNRKIINNLWISISLISLIYLYLKYVNLLTVLSHFMLNISIFGVMSIALRFFLDRNANFSEYLSTIKIERLREKQDFELEVSLAVNNKDINKFLSLYKANSHIEQLSPDIKTKNYDDLYKIKALKDSGIITDEEFEVEKRKILNS